MDDSTMRRTKGRSLATNPNATSARPGEPAFAARPEGAPVYYGFPLLEDVFIDDFILGKITDFEMEPCECGDSFVVAPDGSRAGLVWEITTEPYFHEVLSPEPDRWGVWGVGFQLPMSSRSNARQNFAAILPELKVRWQTWKQARAEGAHLR